MLAGKTILISGATGFVGTRLAVRLRDMGAAVRALVRQPAALPGVEQVSGDLSDPASLARAAAGCAFVVHSAVTYSENWGEAVEVNVEGTRRLAQAALDSGVERFIHISTCGVYNLARQEVVTEDTPLWDYDETSRLVYGITKAEAERVIWDFAGRGLPVVVLRPPNILGAHPRSGFAAEFAQAVRSGRVRLGGEGGNTWPYVHVENFCDAAISALVRPQALGQAYNIVDGHTTFREFASRYASWLGVALQQRPIRPPYDLFTGEFATEKARRDLDYTPRVSYDQAMEETRQYLQETGLL